MLESILAAIAWTTLAIVASQATSIAIMWWLGLPPKKLIHEIEVVQNAAVGACFFIISLTASLFIGVYFSDGFSRVQTFGDSAAWFIMGLLISAVYVAIAFAITHRVMGRENNESVYGYMRREIVEEQNASLAFFLGGISVSPFLAMVFQII
ncbi:MAG: hypothetical protein RLP44_00600 [Aggregatilineales bacterium]